MPKVNSCCCFDLKTGTIIIATLGWIGTLVNIFRYTAATASYSDQLTETEANFLYFNIALCIFAFFICVLLFVGVFKKSPGFFIPYLILAGLGCVGYTLGTGYCLILIFNYGSAALIAFVILACVTALSWYFWTVVYSHYQEVKAETECVPAAGNIHYSQATNNPPPYNEKERAQLA